MSLLGIRVLLCRLIVGVNYAWVMLGTQFKIPIFSRNRGIQNAKPEDALFLEARTIKKPPNLSFLISEYPILSVGRHGGPIFTCF